MNPIFLSFLIGLAVACTSKSQQTDTPDFHSIFAEEFPAGEPGGSILIKKDDEVVFLKSYGVADIETGQPINEHTVFNTGSISKTFVSNGILILKERGLLSLDDPLSKYFDDFDQVEIARKVTIRHLLSHTSGLPDLRNVSENREFFLTAKDQENFEPLKQTERLNFELGSQFQYSNPAYNGLALIIEQVSGQPWQQFIQENIFMPTGMTNSKITNGSHPESDVAHGYIRTKNGTYEENDYGEVPTFAAAGNGGVWSSVVELAKYEKAIQNQAFLSKQMSNESRTVFRPGSWSATTEPFVGYSWFLGESSLFDESNFGVDMIYHTGSQGGFRAIHLVIPDKDILLVALFNRPPKDMRDLVKKSLLQLEKYNWMD